MAIWSLVLGLAPTSVRVGFNVVVVSPGRQIIGGLLLIAGLVGEREKYYTREWFWKDLRPVGGWPVAANIATVDTCFLCFVTCE